MTTPELRPINQAFTTYICIASAFSNGIRDTRAMMNWIKTNVARATKPVCGAFFPILPNTRIPTRNRRPLHHDAARKHHLRKQCQKAPAKAPAKETPKKRHNHNDRCGPSAKTNAPRKTRTQSPESITGPDLRSRPKPALGPQSNHQHPPARPTGEQAHPKCPRRPFGPAAAAHGSWSRDGLRWIWNPRSCWKS